MDEDFRKKLVGSKKKIKWEEWQEQTRQIKKRKDLKQHTIGGAMDELFKADSQGIIWEHHKDCVYSADYHTPIDSIMPEHKNQEKHMEDEEQIEYWELIAWEIETNEEIKLKKRTLKEHLEQANDLIQKIKQEHKDLCKSTRARAQEVCEIGTKTMSNRRLDNKKKE